MKDLKLEVSITDLETFRNLIELLERHFETLPLELQNSLIEVSKEGINDITNKTLSDKGYCNISPYKFKTNFKYKNILSINKILKKVKYIDNNIYKESYPETFYFKINNEIIVEW